MHGPAIDLDPAILVFDRIDVRLHAVERPVEARSRLRLARQLKTNLTECAAQSSDLGFDGGQEPGGNRFANVVLVVPNEVLLALGASDQGNPTLRALVLPELLARLDQ